MVKRLIVFAPHPDDETLGCGGTIAMQEEVREVHVVFMTNGRHSHLHELDIRTNPSPQALGKIRKEEAIHATQILGVKRNHLHFLEFKDGKLEEVGDAAQRKVGDLLQKLQPTEVFYPYSKDFHADHRATCQIVEAKVRTLLDLPQRYQYPIWPPTLQTEEESKTKEIDISNTLKRKKRAIRQYRSQITLFSEKQNRPILSDDFLQYFQRKHEIFLVKD